VTHESNSEKFTAAFTPSDMATMERLSRTRGCARSAVLRQGLRLLAACDRPNKTQGAIPALVQLGEKGRITMIEVLPWWWASGEEATTP